MVEKIKPTDYVLAGKEPARASPNGQQPSTLDNYFLLEQSPDDEGNAQCVARLYADQFLYCEALGWLHYNGQYWQRDQSETELDRAIVETLKARRIEGVKAENEKLVRAAKPSATNVRNCKFLFKSLVPVNVSSFDNDPDLLNCKNGVVDLRTGDLTPHDPGQRFTYCLPVAFNPAADSTFWENWLLQAVGGCQEIVDYMQMALGYTITGHNNEKSLFYVYGRANSGKGVMTETLLKLFGSPLSTEVDFSMFTMRRDGDSQNFDLAGLKPTRFIAASETNKYQALNPRRIKAATGGNAIRCAHKHGPLFTYWPQFTIWLSANEPVNADADDDALWLRVCVIHFPGSYTGDKEDKTLKAKMLQPETLEGILAWIVAGAAAWYGSLPAGLQRPPSLVEETQKHRDDNDEVRQFLDENYVDAPGEYVSYPAMYAQYEIWCQSNGVTPKKKRSFTTSLKRKEYETGGNDNREYMNFEQGGKPITKQVQVVRGLKLN